MGTVILTPPGWRVRLNHLFCCVGLSAADLTYIDADQPIWYYDGDPYLLNNLVIEWAEVSPWLDAGRTGQPYNPKKAGWDLQGVANIGFAQQAANAALFVTLEFDQDGIVSNHPLPHNGPVLFDYSDPIGLCSLLGMTQDIP